MQHFIQTVVISNKYGSSEFTMALQLADNHIRESLEGAAPNILTHQRPVAPRGDMKYYQKHKI
jgi:hypothetical protein